MTKQLWERLHDVEVRDEHVRFYLDMRRSARAPHVGHYPDLNADALIGLIEVLVTANERQRRLLERYAQQMLDPPILVMDKMDVQLSAGGVMKGGKQACIVVEDEWPRIERRLMEVSEDIYFMDFLRSLWRRLTKRSPA